jgi:hypothetical protein
MSKLTKVLLVVIFGPIGVIFGIFLLIISLPFIIFFGLSYLYLKLFRYIRHDPRVELPRLVTKKQVEHTQGLGDVLEYFELLTASIATHSGSVVGAFKKTTRNGEPDDDAFKATTLLSYKQSIESKHAKVSVGLNLVELERDDGEIFYIAQRNDEDPELGAYIEADVTLRSLKSEPFHLNFDFDYEGVYFCIGLLNDGGWYNEKTGQLWSYLSNQKVWMVRYNDKGSEFGFRKSKGIGRARAMWHDSKF